jgi:hypothetical protein
MFGLQFAGDWRTTSVVFETSNASHSDPSNTGMAESLSSCVAPSAAVRWTRRLLSGSALIVALGFLLHTSHDRAVAGKYSLRYSMVLGLIFFAILPGLFWFVRFLTVTHYLRGRGNKVIAVRPGIKIKAMAVIVVMFLIAANAASVWLTAGHIATYDAHAFHPYLQNIPRPNCELQHVNRWGFRGDDIEPTKAADTFRVFVFGGSTVHCGPMPYEQTHCRLLEKRLRAAYPQYRIEVQNLGGEWHSTEHSTIKLLFFAQDFAPDLAVIFHGINDLVRSFEPDFFGKGSYRSDYSHYYGAVTSLVRPRRTASFLIDAAAGHWCSDWRFDQVRLAGPEGKGLNGMVTLFFPKTVPVEITDWRSLPAFRRNLADFVVNARGKQMSVLLGTQPSLYRLELTASEQEVLSFPRSHQFDGRRASLTSMVDGMRRYNNATRRIAREMGVRLVDLEKNMPKTTRYLYDDVHYTAEGNALVGDAFADEIIAWGIVPRTIEHRTGSTQPTDDSREAAPRTARASGGTHAPN